MKRIILLSIFLFILYNLFSQSRTGPGGVGSTDGTSNLVLWLDANTISGINGSTITSWNDGSGNGNDFTGGNGAVFNNPSVNGYPAFNFNGSSHYFERAFTAGITPSNFTILTATNVLSSGTHKAVISNRDDPVGGATAGFILYAVPSSNDWQFWTGRASGAWEVATGGTSTSGSWAGQMIDYQNIVNGKELNINGSIDDVTTHNMTSNTSRPCRVGAGQNETSPNYYFNGDIGEIIMFNIVINSAQKIIINNYLAAKYNYNLNSNDLYSQDNVGNGDYDNEVAGIGRVDALNLHDDAQGTGMMRILNPTGLGNDEFMMWGHDNGIAQVKELIDVPVTVQGRFDRVWRVSEVNSAGVSRNVGDVDVRWDLSGLGTIVTTDLRLLIDTDNDGVFADETPIGGAANLGGNIYQFAGVSAIANNVRVTLGTINLAATPLPIGLVNFNASLNVDKVDLSWITSSEINNDFFTVERSLDSENWEEILLVPGAGNRDQLMKYFDSDYDPILGVSYYRLKQTDFNGNFEYFNIVPIRFEKTENVKRGISLYPNPVSQGGIVQLEFKNVFESEMLVVLRDAMGRVLYSKNIIDRKIINLPISLETPEGIYLVTIFSENGIHSKKLIIK
jgi:hypothetical protein